MSSVRQQTRVSGARERRTALLYAMSRELVATRGIESLARVAVSHVAEVFQCQAVVLLPNHEGKLTYPRDPPLEKSLHGADLAVAQWVLDHSRQAGLGTDTLPAAPALYVPLQEGGKPLGVLAVLPANQRRILLPEQRHLLETFAGQIGLAVERAQLAETAEGARLNAERESLRNTLLASISHDLRTPLSVIAGAGSALAQHGTALDEATRVSLARSVEQKAREMSDLVSNVLDLMRFESLADSRRPRRGGPQESGIEAHRSRGGVTNPRRSAAGPRGRQSHRAGLLQPLRQHCQIHTSRHEGVRLGDDGRHVRPCARGG
jgi:two-component system sensor histidine kinase KdpD